MSTDTGATYFNKSAYIALSCLIAFVIVITICVIKQFIWDPLLSKHFKVLRPVLSESIRRFSSSFYRSPSSRTSLLSTHHSYSDIYVKANDPPSLSCINVATTPLNLPTNGSLLTPPNNRLSVRSYGASSPNTNAYTNFGSGDLDDERKSTPHLSISLQYNPLICNIKLIVQNLRHMNSYNYPVKVNDYILIRFNLTKTKSEKPHETSPQRYQDFIRFCETFTILSSIHPMDELNYEIKFSVVLITDGNMHEIASATYSMKDYSLKDILFVETTLPMQFKLA